jgi:ribosome biogenesis protein UTP30
MSKQLDNVLILRAINALISGEQKKSSEKKESLLGNYAKPILVQIQLKEQIKKEITRPVRVKIPHSLFLDSEDHTICFFCKSDDKVKIQEHLESNPIDGLTKIISVNELKKEYKQYNDKKILLRSHTHFICDANIMQQVYNLLGKVFADRNNQPIPMDLQDIKKDFQKGIVKVTQESSYMHMRGCNIAIRFGLTVMKAEHITKNITSGLDFAIQKFKNNWKDVHSIIVKTSDSAGLPIYSKQPSEQLKFLKKKAEELSTTSAVSNDTPKKGKKGKKELKTPIVEEIKKVEKVSNKKRNIEQVNEETTKTNNKKTKTPVKVEEKVDSPRKVDTPKKVVTKAATSTPTSVVEEVIKVAKSKKVAVKALEEVPVVEKETPVVKKSSRRTAVKEVIEEPVEDKPKRRIAKKVIEEPVLEVKRRSTRSQK